MSAGQLYEHGASLFHIRDGKVTRLVVYWYLDRALADLGLTPEGEPPRTSEMVEAVRRGYDTLNQVLAENGDLSQWVREVYDREIVMEMGLIEGTIRGHEGVQRFIEGQAAIMEGLRSEPKEVIEAGARIIVPFRLTGTGAHTGMPMAYDFVHVHTLRGDKVVHVRLYADLEKALTEAGTSIDEARAAAERLAEERG